MTERSGDAGRGPDQRARRREEGSPAAAARIQHQTTWVDVQLRKAMERGDYDDLPGYGKPLDSLTGQHDPDWWVRRLVERERITVLPPSLQLRKEDEELDAHLDQLATAAEVRRSVEEFNARVRWALYRPPQGPPMVTARRDVDVEVERWQQRRRARLEERRAAARARAAQDVSPGGRRLFRRRRSSSG
jgi:hypothetical protein